MTSQALAGGLWVLALASLALGGLAWLGLDYGARP